MERPTGGTPAASALARHCEATGVSLPRCGVVNGQLGIGYCGIMALRNYDLITLRLWGSDWSVPESQPGPARPIPLPPHRQAQWRVIAARSASAPYRRSARAQAQRLIPSPAQPGLYRPIPTLSGTLNGASLRRARRARPTGDAPAAMQLDQQTTACLWFQAHPQVQFPCHQCQSQLQCS